MFSDDEDELELLRQYGDRDLHADDEEGHSSDEMDSDLEDKIMSMVQYGSGLKKKAPLPEKKEPEVIHAPEVDNNKKLTTFSTANELQISEDNDTTSSSSNEAYESAEEDIGVPESPAPAPATVQEAQPQVTRYINLDDRQYMEDMETSEEEAELNSKLQDLIDEQISKRQGRTRYTSRPIRVCFGCHQPGHEKRDCNKCGDCGGERHPDGRCVGVRYCGRCKMRGHNMADCDNDRETKSCYICNTHYHNALNCPSLLHVYENEKPSKTKPVAYCYNCTSKGHYGDECPDLPKYLQTVPSAFSQLSLSSGNRFDPKKTLKSSAASFSQSANHQRWSDSSRESSPRRNNYGNNNNGNSYKKRRYNDSDNEYNNGNSYKNNYKNGSSSSRDNDRDYKKKGNANSYKDNSAGGKRRRTDLDDSRSNLDNFFTPAKNSNKKKGKEPQHNNTYNGKSGNSNWKAMNNSTLPQPTRSGTVNMNNNKGKGDRQSQQDYSGDFPRGNGSNLPKPSSSGVIDLTKDDDNNGYSKRGPKYHGGYNRR